MILIVIVSGLTTTRPFPWMSSTRLKEMGVGGPRVGTVRLAIVGRKVGAGFGIGWSVGGVRGYTVVLEGMVVGGCVVVGGGVVVEGGEVVGGGVVVGKESVCMFVSIMFIALAEFPSPEFEWLYM